MSPDSLSPAEAAVLAVLQQMRTDMDLRYSLLFTDAFCKLCAAEAARSGASVEDIEVRYSAPERGGLPGPKIPKFRRAVAEIRRLLKMDDEPFGTLIRQQLDSVRDL